LILSDEGTHPQKRAASDYLFDLHSPAGESENLGGRGLAIQEQLRRAYYEWKASLQKENRPAEAFEYDAETLERLRDLGYLQ
jgi:hypothetical protein